jgi:hypothetical protein
MQKSKGISLKRRHESIEDYVSDFYISPIDFSQFNKIGICYLNVNNNTWPSKAVFSSKYFNSLSGTD